jgi:hypothetical protein
VSIKQPKNNMDVLIEALLEFVMIYPGAVVRWVFFRKRSFSSYLSDPISDNVMAFVAILVSIILIFLGINVII